MTLRERLNQPPSPRTLAYLTVAMIAVIAFNAIVGRGPPPGAWQWCSMVGGAMCSFASLWYEALRHRPAEPFHADERQ
jgi:hypothetical protein